MVPAQLSASAQLRGGSWVGPVRTARRHIDLEGVTAAWYRSPRAYQFPDGLSDVERTHVNVEAKYELGGVPPEPWRHQL